MDEFGVLVESIGFRSHGRSAPMAKLKPKPKSNFTAHSTANTLDDSYSLPVDELDGIFRSKVNISKTRQSQNTFVDDDIFGGPVSSSNQYGGVDLESVFSSSNNRSDNGSNLDSKNYVGSNAYDDLLGSESKQNDPVDDLFGNFGGNSSGKQEKRGAGFDDLIPGLGGARPSMTRVFSGTNLPPVSDSRPSNPSSTVIDDPFLAFESSVSQSDSSWSFVGSSDQDTGKVPARSWVDDFDDFSMGGTRSGSKVDEMRTSSKNPSSGTSSNGFENGNYLDEMFGGSNAVRQNNADSLFGDFFHDEKKPEVEKTSSQSSFSPEKKSNATYIGNDFTSLFRDVVTPSGEFQEREGEPEDRRIARLNRHMRMNARMAEALAEKNQRDLQIQYEQDEKRRLADALEIVIKRWAAGKEGNLRALLSSLQQVLWPECGWRPVSLTDLITSESVKKVYKKATLCVHPDKVQQKGATLQQKYIAEKVFDILKEAWNKFSTEELR